MTDEISRAERARQDRLAEKPKEQERPKDTRSQFDRVMDESRLSQKAQPMTQTPGRLATEQAAKEAEHRGERERDEGRRDDKDREKGRDEGSSSRKGTAKEADQRVVAKGHLKEGRGGGGGEGRGGFSFGGGRKDFQQVRQKLVSKETVGALHGKFAEKLSTTIAQRAAEPAMTQAVLSKIVQYVRIGINRMGDKEIQVDLHEKIFRGLKLRVTSSGGKVTVHFMAADSQTRTIFNKNTDAIKDALEKKGILVEDILVT